MPRKVLYFDIETALDESRLQLWETYVSEKKERNPEIKDNDLKAALLPEFCKVVAIGWAIDEQEPDSLVVGLEHQTQLGTSAIPTEANLLKKFWDLASTDKPLLVGFNILNFDLPVLFVRSALLGVGPKRYIDRKAWGDDCIDLLETRRYTNGGGKLKELARWFGLEVPEPEVDGSMAEDLAKSDPARLSRYVKSDIVITRQLHKFYKGYFVR